ncbi:MAG: hypothetical protein AB1791_13050 [Chloroflexota bacterium]
MKPWHVTLVLALLLLGVAAGCASTDTGQPTPPLSGPALVMFYTDN